MKAALLAGHAQHPVIIHFPIALFIASAVFDVLAVWRKQPLLATVAYYNLLGAAVDDPISNRHRSGSLAMAARRARAIKGNLRLHMICALTSALLILFFAGCGRASGQRAVRRRAAYFAVMALGLMMITLTGHLGGILSGRGNAVTLSERRSNQKFQSDVKRVPRFDRAEAATQSPADDYAARGRYSSSDDGKSRSCCRRQVAPVRYNADLRSCIRHMNSGSPNAWSDSARRPRSKCW